VSQKVTPKICWQYFPNKWKLFLKCFTYSLNVHTYAKSPSVIELFLTLAKSCHIKRDHLVMSLHFANNSGVWLISTQFGMVMQNVFLKCAAVENFNFQNPRWRTAAILKIEKSLYLMMVFPKHRQKCCQKTLGGGGKFVDSQCSRKERYSRPIWALLGRTSRTDNHIV